MKTITKSNYWKTDKVQIAYILKNIFDKKDGGIVLPAGQNIIHSCLALELPSYMCKWRSLVPDKKPVEWRGGGGLVVV